MLERLNATLAGRYTVERELGRGGMASVWLARDLRHERPVAIKLLRAELAGAIGVDRFLREIRLTAALRHPHIIPVLDSGVVQDIAGNQLPWYAMPYVAGESLRERLRREGHLPVDEAIGITERAAAALAYAHRLGIVHRDIKPENLLLADGEVYLADFGIARALVDNGGERLTSTGLALGTPAYMSPEQAMGQEVDGRTDQYSLAGVLYEMLAGEPPFTGPTPQAVVARRLAEPVRPLRSVRATVPVSAEAAVLRALERIPADRFPDIASFAEALRAQTDEVPRAPPLRRRHRGRAGVLALLVVLALGAWGLVRARDHAPPVRDPEAVALYRRGLHGYDQRTAEGVRDAIAALEAAVRRDSTYTEAWSVLARAYCRADERGFLSATERESALRRAVTAADRAMPTDHPTAEGWVTRAIVSRAIDPTDLTPAIQAARRALAIDPRNAPAWHILGLCQAESGLIDSALVSWHRSTAADPSYSQGVAFTAIGFYLERRYDSATVWADSAVALDPTYNLGRNIAGDVAIAQGDWVRARAATDAARRLGTDAETLARSALVEYRSGVTGEGKSLLQRADSVAAGSGPPTLHMVIYLAAAHAVAGDRAGAVDWLRRFEPSRNLHFQLHLRCDPLLDVLARDPGFRALRDEVALPGCTRSGAHPSS
jgi:tetratricopeptide (TPR) repeat protein